MIVAGLDVATKTGIAVLNGNVCLHWEAHRPKGDGDAEIFHGFRTWLRSTLIAQRVEMAAIEEPLRTDLKRKRKPDGQSNAFGGPAIMDSVTSMRTYLRLYGLFGHAVEILGAMNIPFHVVHQGTWRSAFLGNGRADKSMSIAQCKRLGWHITSPDAAEAAGVAFWLQGKLAEQRAGELALRASAA